MSNKNYATMLPHINKFIYFSIEEQAELADEKTKASVDDKIYIEDLVKYSYSSNVIQQMSNSAYIVLNSKIISDEQKTHLLDRINSYKSYIEKYFINSPSEYVRKEVERSKNSGQTSCSIDINNILLFNSEGREFASEYQRISRMEDVKRLIKDLFKEYDVELLMDLDFDPDGWEFIYFNGFKISW